MRTILIVEDDTLLSGVLQTAFRRAWNVEIAANAADALVAFRESTPDIVLTDKNMPGMNGLELLHAIRKIDPHVGMVVMTAYGTEESASDAFNVGVDAYVEKPFPDLLALVSEMLLLGERVDARREKSPGPAVTSLRVFAAGNDAARRQALSAMFEPGDTVEWFATFDELVSAVAGGGCQLTLVDCGPLGVAADDAAIKLDARNLPCVIVAEGLRVPEITRLIDLGVKSLLNGPRDARAAGMLKHALARIRHS